MTIFHVPGNASTGRAATPGPSHSDVVILIRHASAGDRETWDGLDRLRPLDERGLRQAAELVDLLASHELSRLLSSPALRCVQTIGPLAEGRGIQVEIRDELSEERQQADGASLVHGLEGNAAAVSCHGGLSNAVCGVSQRKSEVLVVERGIVVDRVRARGR